MSADLVEHVKQVWNDAQKEIREECGKDQKKRALAEILGLRELAVQALAAKEAETKPKKPHKKFTR